MYIISCLSPLQQKAKSFVNFKVLDRKVKDVQARVNLVSDLLNGTEAYYFLNECSMDEDKREILDNMTYTIKKIQGGYKTVFKYNPIDLLADYILFQKSKFCKTRLNMDDSKPEKHQHNGMEIEVRPMSDYDDVLEDDDGNSYSLFEQMDCVEDEYFAQTTLMITEFLSTYDVFLKDKELLQFLGLKAVGMKVKEVKELTGLSESQQYTKLKYVADLCNHRREIEPVSNIEKVCKNCHEQKTLDKFAVEKRNKDGRKNICKSCDSKRKITGNSKKKC